MLVLGVLIPKPSDRGSVSLWLDLCSFPLTCGNATAELLVALPGSDAQGALKAGGGDVAGGQKVTRR